MPRNRATGAAVADGVDLRRLALAVVERAAQWYVAGPPRPSQAPRNRSCATDRRRRAACRRPCPLDLPERLAAELEVVALLIDRVAAVARRSGCRFDAADQFVERRSPAPVRATRSACAETARCPRLGVQAAVRALAPDERRQIARRLPVDEHAVLDQMPALPRHAFVVVADGREPSAACGRRRIDDLRRRSAACRSCRA